MLKANRRNLIDGKQLVGLKAPVAGDDTDKCDELIAAQGTHRIGPRRSCIACSKKLARGPSYPFCYAYFEDENSRAAHGSYPCKVNLCDGSLTVVPACSSGKKRIPLEVYRRRLYDRTSAGETLLSLHKALELHTVTDTVQVEAIEQAIADVERRYPISEFKFRGEQNSSPETGGFVKG